MANHPSALKRHRQSEKRRLRNRVVRAVRTAVASRDPAAAAQTLARASRELDKAVTKGVLHRNSAARKISRLAHAVGALATTS